MLNLVHIFGEQQRLNTETAAKHEEYGLLTRDELTRNFVFAALAELGECANEWGHFKIWKSTRKENRDAPCGKCGGENHEECIHCEGGRTNPLREEYIDVFHFGVSVAIGLDVNPAHYESMLTEHDLKELKGYDAYDMYLKLFEKLAYANVLLEESLKKELSDKAVSQNTYDRQVTGIQLMDTLLALGYSLGFDDEDITAAYFSKHQINQKRQENNY